MLALGAHPDDIELGADGTPLNLADYQLQVRYVVLTGTPDRQLEARNAAQAFLPTADLTVELHDLPEGRFPAVWAQVKEVLEEVARSFSPDLVIGPSPGDAHQDHRTIGEIVPTVLRDQLCLAYEIPKWDGDLGHPLPSAYVPLTAGTAQKGGTAPQMFPSQSSRDWWDARSSSAWPAFVAWSAGLTTQRHSAVTNL